MYYGFQVTDDLGRPYVEQVKNYSENGYAREIPVDSIRADTVWSLPVHAFKHKPYSKIWVIFILTAKGLLFNDVIQDPCVANSVLGVFLWLRMKSLKH